MISFVPAPVAELVRASRRTLTVPRFLLDELAAHLVRRGHVATTFMVEAGEHPRVIQHRLGHGTARLSMELYAHVPEPADREIAARLQERFTRTAMSDVGR